jgi:hypothetical protein
MSDVKKRPVKETPNLNDWIVVHNENAGLGDEKRINLKTLINRFINTIFSADKSSNTDGSDLYQCIATGVTTLKVTNKSSTNKVYFGLGLDAAEAKFNRDNGVPGLNRFLIRPGVVANIYVEENKFCAWVSVGGTATINLEQGV